MGDVLMYMLAVSSLVTSVSHTAPYHGGTSTHDELAGLSVGFNMHVCISGSQPSEAALAARSACGSPHPALTHVSLSGSLTQRTM